MNTFEITIQRKTSQSWPLVIRHIPASGALAVWSQGSMQLDPKKLETMLPTSKEFGLQLGKALFQNDIRDAFVRALAASKATGETLRVLLFIEAEDLRSLHWEQLHAPLDRGWDYLILNQGTPFSIYLPSQIERRFPPIGRRDLRALIFVAGAEELNGDYGLAEFDVRKTAESVRTALGEIPSDILASIESASGPPTLDSLSEHLNRGRYTLLHIVCHGAYKKDSGETVLYFPKDERRSPTTATELIRRLERMERLPQFTFLSTCESADPEAETGLGGLAQRLIRELGMPAVLAMTDKVSIPTAEALSSAFYTRLREHGEVDRALGEAMGSLQGHYDVTVPALFSRLGGRPLFSDTLDRPLTEAEIRFGLEQLKGLVAQRAPVLTEEFERNASQIQAILGTDIQALSTEARADYQSHLNVVNQMCGEVIELSFNALALGQSPPAYDDRCPFQGLMAFKPENHEFFFGRETTIDKLAERLKRHNFLAILGPSGSGKSSLVFAGLIPKLNVPWTSLTPGNEPLTSLDATVKDEHQLIVVDQFEELFTLTQNEGTRKDFIARLLELAQDKRVVLTMRADFWGEVAPYAALRDETQAHQELVPPMSADELRGAMERQADKVGLRFESDLGQDILDDVEGEPGAMPLLQHALLLLWQRRHGRWLRQDEYRAIGGVQKAIATSADSLYESLTPSEQTRLQDIFMHLTRLEDEPVHGEARDTRRRASLAELVPAGSDPHETQILIQKLADARLVVTSDAPNGQGQMVDVAHEALIRYWPRLRTWLEQNREDLILHRQLSDATNQWHNLKQDPGALLRGARLEQSDALAQRHPNWINKEDLEFLETSLENTRQEVEQAKRTHRFQALLGSIAGLLVLSLFSLLWVNGFFAPRQMGGVFNVAVSDFGEISSNEQLAESKTGKQVSQWAVNYLRETLGNDSNVEIWPKKGGALDRTRIGLVTATNVKEIATDINANLIYYGQIKPVGTHAELVLGFYIAPQFEYRFEDIQGNYSPGHPIIADLENPGPSIQTDLEKQTELIAQLVLGLTQAQLGNSEQALAAFEQAARADPNSAVVQFFIGRENLFLAGRMPNQHTEYRQAAEEAFQKAISLDNQYARAYIGLGSVYTDSAAGLLDDAITSGQPPNPQVTQYIEQATQNYQKVLDLNPNPDDYGNPVADVARIALGHTYQLKGETAALQGDLPSALIDFDQAIKQLNEVRQVFEASTQSNESYRRYLTQVYEYLGETYQWQGYVHELAFAYPEATQSYQQALSAYQQCSAQAENTPDVIIRDQIVGQYCQPYALDAQSRLDSLNGEQK